jgi:hypothetical protein
MAESFVKTFKRDYVRVNPIPDARTALLRIDHWMEDYNSEHPHSRLGYRSPREYIASIKPAECPVYRGQLHLERSETFGKARMRCYLTFRMSDPVQSSIFVKLWDCHRVTELGHQEESRGNRAGNSFHHPSRL